MPRPHMHHDSAPARRGPHPAAGLWILALLGAGSPRAAASEPPRSIIQPAGELAAAAAAGPGAGLATSRASDVLGEQLQLPPGTGLVVDAAAADSPAARAGLRRHDVLVSLDEQPLGTPEQLLALLAAAAPDAPLLLDVRRGGKALSIPLGSPATRPAAATATATATAVPPGAAAAPAAVASPAPPAPPPTPSAPAARPALAPPPGARRIGPDAVVLEDRDCRLKVYRDSDTHLAMCDARGWLVFNGPISTPAQRSLIPRRVRDRVERLEMMLDSVVAPPTAATPPTGAPVAAAPPAGAAPAVVPAAPPAAAPRLPPAGASEEPVAEIGRLDVPPIEIR